MPQVFLEVQRGTVQRYVFSLFIRHAGTVGSREASEQIVETVVLTNQDDDVFDRRGRATFVLYRGP